MSKKLDQLKNLLKEAQATEELEAVIDSLDSDEPVNFYKDEDFEKEVDNIIEAEKDVSMENKMEKENLSVELEKQTDATVELSADNPSEIVPEVSKEEVLGKEQSAEDVAEVVVENVELGQEATQPIHEEDKAEEASVESTEEEVSEKVEDEHVETAEDVAEVVVESEDLEKEPVLPEDRKEDETELTPEVSKEEVLGKEQSAEDVAEVVVENVELGQEAAHPVHNDKEEVEASPEETKEEVSEKVEDEHIETAEDVAEVVVENVVSEDTLEASPEALKVAAEEDIKISAETEVPVVETEDDIAIGDEDKKADALSLMSIEESLDIILGILSEETKEDSEDEDSEDKEEEEKKSEDKEENSKDKKEDGEETLKEDTFFDYLISLDESQIDEIIEDSDLQEEQEYENFNELFENWVGRIFSPTQRKSYKDKVLDAKADFLEKKRAAKLDSSSRYDFKNKVKSAREVYKKSKGISSIDAEIDDNDRKRQKAKEKFEPIKKEIEKLNESVLIPAILFSVITPLAAGLIYGTANYGGGSLAIDSFIKKTPKFLELKKEYEDEYKKFKLLKKSEVTEKDKENLKKYSKRLIDYISDIKKAVVNPEDIDLSKYQEERNQLASKDSNFKKMEDEYKSLIHSGQEKELKNLEKEIKKELSAFILSNKISEYNSKKLNEDLDEEPVLPETRKEETEELTPEVSEEEVLGKEQSAEDVKEVIVESDETCVQKEFDVDAVIETKDGAEMGTEKNKEEIEAKRKETASYKSLKEACMLDEDYFSTDSYTLDKAEDKTEKLVKQIALLIARESMDPLYDELLKATVYAKRLRNAVCEKYHEQAAEKSKLITKQ